MTRFTILGGLTLGVYFLQVTVLPQLLLYRLRIDLLLIWVVAFGLLTNPKRGLIFGLSVGLLMDLTLFHPFGLNIFCKGLAGYLTGNLARTFFREQLRLPLLIEFAAIITQELFLYFFYFSVLGSRIVLDDNITTEFFLMVVYSLCFAGWFYRLLAQVVGWLDKTAADRSERT